MFKVRSWVHEIAPLLVVLAAGCAPAYHSYSGCYVDCTYCAPPPLPYVHYEGCVCHACVVRPHLQSAGIADERTAGAGARDKRRY